MNNQEFNQIKPYCYYIKRKSDGLQYFGVRWKNFTKYKRTPIEDFGVYYFSSHSILKKEFKLKPGNFESRIVSTFNTVEEARDYEYRFNKKIIKNKNWLNIQAFPQIIHNTDTKLKISEWHLGKKLSDNTKNKVRQARKGTKASIKTKEKMSSSQKGNKNHYFGKKHSEETLKKMRGRKVSDEVKKKISEKLKGRKLSKEVIKKMVLSRKGFKHSAITKEKLSILKVGKLNPFYGKKLTNEHKKSISEGLKRSRKK